MRLELTLPLRTARGQNGSHSHWSVVAKRRKAERQAVAMVLGTALRRIAKVYRPEPPIVAVLTRISPGTRPMDDDGVVSALKSVRDEVAAQLGLDDGNRKAIQFTYGQERGPWGVRIILEAREAQP